MAVNLRSTAALFRIWLLPLSLLGAAAALVLGGTMLVDSDGAGGFAAAWALLTAPDPQSAAETLSSAGEIVAAVLAIAITVVAIIVELAANRYTHRIPALFLKAPANFLVMGFFIVTALQAIGVSLLFDWSLAGEAEFIPRAGIQVALVMLAGSLLILLPYFGYVFAFLNPMNIIDRIRRDILDDATSSRRASTRQARSVRGIEHISDMALNAVQHHDKGVSVACVEALGSVLLDYQGLRGQLDDEWFSITGERAHDLDFVAMAPEIRDALAARRVWFEVKILRQFQDLFSASLGDVRDIAHLVAIQTRRLGEQAFDEERQEVVRLVVKFFNTYLRAAINGRDVRTAFNVLQQMRIFAERGLSRDDGAMTVEIARYLRYYARIACEARLTFIADTIAYDVCELNEAAYLRRSMAAPSLLKSFLKLDEATATGLDTSGLRGVRKAQAKLATFYLLHGDERPARKIYRDMKREPPVRLAALRDEMLRVEDREFWEINDRGVNLDYLPPERQVLVSTFFGWFEGLKSVDATFSSSGLIDQTLVPTRRRED